MLGAINGFGVKSLFNHGGWMPWEGGIFEIMWVSVTVKGKGAKRKAAMLAVLLPLPHHILVCSIQPLVHVLFMRIGKRNKRFI